MCMWIKCGCIIIHHKECIKQYDGFCFICRICGPIHNVRKVILRTSGFDLVNTETLTVHLFYAELKIYL